MVDKKKDETIENIPEQPEVSEDTALMESMEDTDETAETEEPTEEETPEETPEETEPDALLVAVQKFYPDVTQDNLNEMAVQTITKLSSIQDKLGDVADEFPEFAMMLNDALKGMPPDEAIARHYGTDLTPPEDAPDWERINKRREEYGTAKAEKEAKMQQLDKNRDVSVENAQKFIEDTGLSEEDATKFLDWFDALHADMFDGLISPENLQALYKGYVHDGTIAEKDEQINELTQTKEVAGKNKAIQEKKMNTEETDNIPKLGGGGGKAPEKKKEDFGTSFFKGVL